MKLEIERVGGGIGSAGRYWLGGVVQKWTLSGLPYGTFIVNLLGCFLIGVLMSAFEDRFLVNPLLRTFLTIGIL